MDNIIVTIAVILIIGIIAFLIFNIFIKSKLTIDNQLDNENSLPIELPWEVQSINSTDLALYRQPESLTLTDHLKSHIGDVIRFSPNAKNIVKSEKKVICLNTGKR